MSSKTARSSAVKEVAKQKQIVPDSELLRQLRIDLAAGIYPGQQHAAAVLRLHDQSQLALVQATESLQSATEKIAAFQEQFDDVSRQLILANSKIETYQKTIHDLAIVGGVTEKEIEDIASLPGGGK